MNRYCRFFLTLLITLMVCLGSGPIAADTIDPSMIVPSAEAYFEQGLSTYQSGQFQSAIDYWRQALELSTDPQQRAQTLGNLAIAYYETGQYIQALEANQTALELFTNLEQTAAVGQVQSNLGNVYEALGDYDRAISIYQESLVIARDTNDRRAEGITIGNLGYLYSLEGDQAAALAAYNESLTIARETGDREGEGHRLLNIGIAHHAMEDVTTAADYYERSLGIAREVGHLMLQARALGNLGMAIADAGDYEAAIAYYEESLAISQTLQNPELTARTLNNLGHTLLAANQLDLAEAQLRDAIASFDTLRVDLDDAYSISIFETQIYTYNLLAQVLVAQNRPGAALEIAEAGRARAFTELLRRRSGLSQTDVARPNGDGVPLSVADIQAISQQTNTTFVEYSLVPEEDFRVYGKQRGRVGEIYMWVIAPDKPISFRQLPLAADTPALTELVGNSRKELGVGDRGLGVVQREDPGQPQGPDPLQTLHQFLIDPIEDLLPQGPDTKVTFIPQGELFLVPFAALMNDQGDRLIEHHTILTAPSIGVLNLIQQRRGTLRATQTALASRQDWLIVGNPAMPPVWHPQTQTLQPLPPLQGAEREALEVAALFETDALTGQDASESRVRADIETAKVIHLATHGLLEYGSAQSSGIADIPGAIALAPDRDQDGLLTSAEIIDELTLQADLVVLSACDTGRGDITGDGVLGLSRSLIAAGTHSLVVSLWAVPDAPTASLMIAFYQALKQGNDKAHALRQAMLTMLEAYPEPQNWAAFTMIGDAS